MKRIYAKLLLCSMLFSWSCSSDNVDNSTLSGIGEETKTLGNLYKSIEDEYLDANCITGTEIISTENTPKKIMYKEDSTFSDIVEKLSLNSELSGNYFTVKANTSLNWAVDNQISRSDETHTFIWKSVKGKRKYLTNSVDLDRQILNSERLAEIQGQPHKIYNFCGDSFISEVEYGASLMVTLRFQFLSEKDKSEFKQKTDIEFDDGVLKMTNSTSIESLSERLKETGRVTIEAQQIGGEDSALLDLISSEMSSCSMQNLTQCMTVMNGVFEYAKRLKTSFDSSPIGDDISKKWDVIGYTTTDYKDLRRSAPYNFFNVELPELTNEFKELRNLMITKWMDNKKMLVDARRYESANGLSNESIHDIETIIESLVQNQKVLDDVQAYCYRSSLEDCQSQWQVKKGGVTEVEKSFASFKADIEDEFENRDQCRNVEEFLNKPSKNTKTLLDAALFGPKRTKVSVRGHHWNVSKHTYLRKSDDQIRIKGKLTRNIKGLMDDHMNYDCTWGKDGKISMSKKIKFNNLNRGWTNAAINIAQDICKHAYYRFVLFENTCK